MPERYRYGRTVAQMEAEAQALTQESLEFREQVNRDSVTLVTLHNRMASIERQMHEHRQRIQRIADRYHELQRAIHEEKARLEHDRLAAQKR